jgi:hypothetical protein
MNNSRDQVIVKEIKSNAMRRLLIALVPLLLGVEAKAELSPAASRLEQSCMDHSFKDKLPASVQGLFCRCVGFTTEDWRLSAQSSIPFCSGLATGFAAGRDRGAGSANSYDVLQEMIKQNGLNFRQMIQ